MNFILLENFQRHLYLKVEFDSITTIVGPTDSGKSAIFRALRWVCLNKAPTRLMRDGAKFVRVTLQVGDAIIIREATNTLNKYSLKIGEEAEKVFVAFKTEVPEEIRKILQVSEINFQRQHDSPFWFSESSGEVSRQLNQIVDLDIIDTTLSNVASQVRTLKNSEEVARQKLEKSEKEKEDLRYVVEMRRDWEQLEEKQRVEQESRFLLQELDSILHSVQTHRTRLETATSAHDEAVLLREKAELSQNLETRRRNLVRLHRIIVQSSETANKPIPNIDFLVGKERLYQSAAQEVFDLKRWLNHVKNLERKSLEADAEYSSTHRSYHESFPDVCPLCQRKM